MNARIAWLAATAAALAGCASGYHDSQLDGTRYYRAPIDTHPVIISRVDGRSAHPSRPVRVDPGPREVVVQTYPDRLSPLGEERTVRLDVKPCTHYYLVAVKQNPLLRDYEVRVDHEEPVPGCTPPPAR